MSLYRGVNGAYIVRSFFAENDAQRLEIALDVMFVFYASKPAINSNCLAKA